MLQTEHYKNVTYFREMSPDSMVGISGSLYNIQKGKGVDNPSAPENNTFTNHTGKEWKQRWM